MKNVFIILNPFQLMCAIEARQVFAKNEKNILVIIDRANPGEVAYDQVTNMIDSEWNTVVRIFENKNRGLKRNIKLLYNMCLYVVKVGPLSQYLFIGDDRVAFMKIVAFMFGGSVTRLDDGIDAIFSLNKYLLGKALPKQKSGFPHYFTIFRENNILYGIYKNTFMNLFCISRGKEWLSLDSTVIVGKALSERLPDLYSFEMKVIKEIQAIKKSVTYIPHRHDSLTKIAEIKASGCNVVNIEKPIELYLLECHQLPLIVLSIGSTALITLKLMFPNIRCVSIIPDLKSMNEALVQDYVCKMRELESFSVEVRSIEQFKIMYHI